MKLPLNGVCPKWMNLEIENGVITELDVAGGCDGNLKGLKTLLIGAKAEDVAERLQGITCGRKSTSCPDQIAKAIRIYLKAEEQKQS